MQGQNAVASAMGDGAGTASAIDDPVYLLCFGLFGDDSYSLTAVRTFLKKT
jgi:hypothetical protein